jgi:hypothetical protein
LLFPFFTFFFATITTSEGIELLGVGDLKLMMFLVTLKGNLLAIKTIHYNESLLGRYLSAGIVELLAFIAPTVTTTTCDPGL